jgi:ubiquinone/menaquinone biosynthesis C-methylase UbiE
MKYITVIAILVLAILLFIIVTAASRRKNVSGSADDSFVDRQLSKKVQSAIIKYVNITILPLLNDDKAKFKTKFNNCVRTTANRKKNLTQIRVLLRSSKLGSANAGRDDKWRINKRAKHINFMAEKLNLKLSGPYLDIGCGDGSITNAISEKLLSGSKSVSMPTCIEYGEEGIGFNSNVIRQTDITQLKSGTFNFITAFMSLHHIDKVEHMISEISRVTDIGGILIIREHNFPFCAHQFSNAEARQYLDWIHIIYDLAESYTVDELYGSEYRRSNYQPEQYWNDAFDKNGFKKIHSTNYKNQLCSYYAVYIKQ